LTDYLITTFNNFLPGGQQIIAKAPAAKKAPLRNVVVHLKLHQRLYRQLLLKNSEERLRGEVWGRWSF